MSATRTTFDEVTCPKCGDRFRLADKVMDHLKASWTRAERQHLKSELLQSPDIQKEIEKRAAKEVRDKSEELRDRDKQIASLRSKVTRLSKQLPADRAQALGDVRQEILGDILRRRFPSDQINIVRRGARGGDVIQGVLDGSGRNCGSILWESKRTTTWQSSWIRKLNGDQRRGNHDAAVIVSETLPHDDRPLAEADGVWICSFETAADLAAVLREGLINVSQARLASDSRADVKGRAYEYLTGQQFVQRVKTVVEIADGLRKSLEKERKALQSQWSERDQHISALTAEMAALYGEIKSTGAALPVVPALELSAPHPFPIGQRSPARSEMSRKTG